MFLRLLAERFGRRVPFDAMHSYDLGVSFELGPEQLGRFMRLAHRPEALASIEPMPGAIEALADWSRQGCEILLVTGRPPETRDSTLGWLDRHQVPYSEFHFLDKYSEFYRGRHGTPEGALGLADLPGLDLALAIEDFPGTAEHLAGDLGVPVALFDRPWNRTVEEGAAGRGAPLVRCRGWDDVRRRFPAPCV